MPGPGTSPPSKPCPAPSPGQAGGWPSVGPAGPHFLTVRAGKADGGQVLGSSVEDQDTTAGNPLDPQVEHLASMLHGYRVPLNIHKKLPIEIGDDIKEGLFEWRPMDFMEGKAGQVRVMMIK